MVQSSPMVKGSHNRMAYKAERLAGGSESLV